MRKLGWVLLLAAALGLPAAITAAATGTLGDVLPDRSATTTCSAPR